MDPEFKQRAEETLHALYQALLIAADDYGFAVNLDAGALAVQCGKPRAKFVISPNAATRQLWVSARPKRYKLDWDVVENTFVLDETGQTLREIVEQVIGHHLREDVSL
jgi:frataxin-like iron-binding protein CyaY